MSITTSIEGVEQAQHDLAARTDKLLLALQRKILTLCLQLQAKIVGNLASGIGLKSRHGTSGLAGSVRVIDPVIEGTMVVGDVQGGGGPFWYGRMWEDVGHKEIVPVTKKVLAFMANGKMVFTMRVSAQEPRPWMKPPFTEMRPQIISEIEATAHSGGEE